MTEDSVSKSPSIDRAIAIVTNADALAAVREIVSAATAYGRVREEEQTKRGVIAAVERAQVERIHAAERTLRDYFERSFAERADTSRALFERLDRALDAGDPQVVHSMVRGVVDLAQSSPLAGLEDFGKFWAEFGTEERPIEL